MLRRVEIESIADRISGRVERLQGGLLAIFSLAYFAVTVTWSKADLFWFDELFTYYVALQPTVHDLWTAVTAGVDQQPPGYFLITRAATGMVGDPHVGLRLPEIFGFWLLSACVYVFVKRRMSAVWGLFAVVALCLTPAFHYAVEARPYTLAAGFAALALASWQGATRGLRRRLSLVGIAFGVAAAISSNYYAVLVVAPLAMGEFARSWWKRSLDRAVWLALACGSGIAVVYLPLVTQYVRSFPARNWASPTSSTVFTLYGGLVDGAAVVVAAVVGLAAIAALWFRSERIGGDEPESAPWELVAAVGFLMLPCFGYAAAMVAVKMIVFRYVLPVTIGFSILASWMLYRYTRASNAACLAAICVFGTIAAAEQARNFAADRGSGARYGVLRVLLAGQPATLPVVVDDPQRCFELGHYEKPDVTERLRYLVDPAASLRYGAVPYQEGTDWYVMNRYMPVHAEPMDEFRRKNRRYLLYTTRSAFGFVLAKVMADGAQVKLVAIRAGDVLYQVDESPTVSSTMY